MATRNELIVSDQSRFAAGRWVRLMDQFFRLALNAFSHFIQDVVRACFELGGERRVAATMVAIGQRKQEEVPELPKALSARFAPPGPPVRRGILERVPGQPETGSAYREQANARSPAINSRGTGR